MSEKETPAASELTDDQLIKICHTWMHQNPVSSTELMRAAITADRALRPDAAPVPLTDEQIEPLWLENEMSLRRYFGDWSERRRFIRAIEAAIHAANQAPLTHAAQDVLAERRRQISVEGWTPEHDDEHDAGELGLAAALYALPYGAGLLAQEHILPLDMALEIACDWTLKPEPDARKRLVKAGALVLAEIERLDRAELAKAKL